MHRAVLVIAIVALGLVTSGSLLADDGSAGWEQIRNDDGITVSRKDVKGSPFVALRGEGDIDAPLLLVGSVLVDITRSKEWVDSLVEAKILREVSETEYITYSHIGTPITMSDRDFVNDVTLTIDPAQKKLAVHMHAVTDATAPKTSYVRGELIDSSFSMTSIDHGKRTHVVAEVHCDPKGSIAAWIVNLFQKNWGYNTLMHLRSQVKKRDLVVHAKLKAALEARGFFDGQ